MFVRSQYMRELFLKGALLALFAFAAPAAAAQETGLIVKAVNDKPAGAPDAPVITSQVFTDPDAWYGAATQGAFRWELPDDVTAVAVNLVSDTETEPTFVFQPAVAAYTPEADALTDGVQYLAVQFRNQNGWGDIAYYKIQIDRVPPRSLYIDIRPTERAGVSDLVFGATDELSGIAGYTLYMNGNGPIFVTPQQATEGFPITHENEGMSEVLAFAYDRAGNSIWNRFPVFVLERQSVAGIGPFGLSLTREQAVSLGLAIFALLALWVAVRTHLYYRRKGRKLREEMYEVQDQMTKIFTALRDEIYDQVQSLSSRKRLSKGEQRVVEDLTKVLEVSETLVNKEITDVKKLLR